MMSSGERENGDWVGDCGWAEATFYNHIEIFTPIQSMERVWGKSCLRLALSWLTSASHSTTASTVSTVQLDSKRKLSWFFHLCDCGESEQSFFFSFITYSFSKSILLCAAYSWGRFPVVNDHHKLLFGGKVSVPWPSTTVIQLGLNLSRATSMIVENAFSQIQKILDMFGVCNSSSVSFFQGY